VVGNSSIQRFKSVSALADEHEREEWHEPTRVYAIADAIEDARRLAEVFARSTDFVVAGFTTAAHLRQLNPEAADVLVIRSRYLEMSAIPGETPVLWLGNSNVGPEESNRTHAWLADDKTGTQVRAAVLALAAGLRLEASPRKEAASPPETEFTLIEPLTERELEVLNLVAEGLSNPQIARRLRVSRNTVKFHVSSIMGKLGASSRTEAVRLGLRRGLIIV
jgi:DNA-binding CsgD family transcriptional regulator